MLNASAEMWLSHGSWYCIHSMDDHTVCMKNDKQMEGRLEVVSSPGRKDTKQVPFGANESSPRKLCASDSFISTATCRSFFAKC